MCCCLVLLQLLERMGSPHPDEPTPMQGHGQGSGLACAQSGCAGCSVCPAKVCRPQTGGDIGVFAEPTESIPQRFHMISKRQLRLACFHLGYCKCLRGMAPSDCCCCCCSCPVGPLCVRAGNRHVLLERICKRTICLSDCSWLLAWSPCHISEHACRAGPGAHSLGGHHSAAGGAQGSGDAHRQARQQPPTGSGSVHPAQAAPPGGTRPPDHMRLPQLRARLRALPLPGLQVGRCTHTTVHAAPRHATHVAVCTLHSARSWPCHKLLSQHDPRTHAGLPAGPV